MKPSSAISLIVLTGAAAFLIGSRTSGGSDGARSGNLETNTRTSPARAVARATPTADDRSTRKPQTGSHALSNEEAGLLSPDQRVALMKKAAVLADPGRQAEVLCWLISAMTPDELTETTKALLDAQRRGNGWSQAVWNSLWTRWGNVDPAACLALSAKGMGMNTSEDYRYLMSGWLDADPQAALAWAMQPGHDPQAAAAAAFAITRSAKGDLKQMESAILAVSGNEATAKACLHDYFDLAISSDNPRTPAALYDEIDPSLRAAAWPVVLERLAYTDPQEAAAWLGKHAADPGQDYRVAYRLIESLSRMDPEGTAEWAVGLPLSNISNGEPVDAHPAGIAIHAWISRDRAAAGKWILSQPEGIPWVSYFRSQFEGKTTE
jgi:hypothetical protein